MILFSPAHLILSYEPNLYLMNTSAKVRFLLSQGWYLHLSNIKARYLFYLDTIKAIRPTGVSAYSRVHGHPRLPVVESARYGSFEPYVEKFNSLLVRAKTENAEQLYSVSKALFTHV